MTPEDVERLVKKIEERGASVTISDPRVTKARDWVLNSIGALAVVVLGWAANSIDTLNKTMVEVVIQNRNTAEILKDHNERLRDLERAEHERR